MSKFSLKVNNQLNCINLLNTKKLKDFKPLFRGLNYAFGKDHYEAILEWCKVLDLSDRNYWKVFVIRSGEKVIGICGLYSINEETKELWLGWFGFLKEYTGRRFGSGILLILEDVAKMNECKLLNVYVDKNNLGAINFYKKNGFKMLRLEGDVTNVRTYKKLKRKEIPNIDDSFGNNSDLIMTKKLH
jgi:RimJ/RimL family protein N-acetyltransferase